MPANPFLKLQSTFRDIWHEARRQVKGSHPLDLPVEIASDQRPGYHDVLACEDEFAGPDEAN